MSRYQETGLLTATTPFDFKKTLAFTSEFPFLSGEQTIQDHVLTRALALDNYTIAYQIYDNGTLKQPEVHCRLYSEEELPETVKQAALERISFFLSLTDDLAPFYAIGYDDPHFAPIIDRLYGLHHVKFPSIQEAACWAVLSQHTAMTIALRQKHAILECYGSSITLEGKEYRAFPTLQQLVQVTPQEWHTLIKNERRATYLSEVIAALSSTNETFLRTAPYEEVERWLLSIKGIGAWSASFLLIRALGRMDKMMPGMKPFMNAMSRVYGTDETWKTLEMRYGRWFGYWGYYMRTAN